MAFEEYLKDEMETDRMNGGYHDQEETEDEQRDGREQVQAEKDADELEGFSRWLAEKKGNGFEVKIRERAAYMLVFGGAVYFNEKREITYTGGDPFAWQVLYKIYIDI